MSKSEDERLWFLAPDLVLPVPAVLAVLQLERAGHRLTLGATGDRIVVQRAPGTQIDPDDLAQLRRWKEHALLFLRYQPPTKAVH